MKRQISISKISVITTYIITLIYVVINIINVFIKQWFSGNYCSFTLFGFILFTIMLVSNVICFEFIKDWWDECD